MQKRVHRFLLSLDEAIVRAAIQAELSCDKGLVKRDQTDKIVD